MSSGEWWIRVAAGIKQGLAKQEGENVIEIEKRYSAGVRAKSR
jgi:hypothetical protein